MNDPTRLVAPANSSMPVTGTFVEPRINNPTRLFNRNYTLQWQGQFFASLGYQAFTIAMVFWLKHSTESASLMGLLQMLSYLPGVLLGPIGGIIADRYSRRNIIILSHFTRGIAAVGLGALIFFRPDATSLILTTVFVVAVFNSVMNAFFAPAISATIPDLVPKDKVTSANSLGQLAQQVSLFVGQGLGGVFYRILGAAMLFVVDGLVNLYAAISESFVSIPQVIPQKKQDRQSRLKTLKEDLVEGFHYIGKVRGLKEIVGVSALLSFFTAPILVLLPFYVEDVLKAKIDWYGFLGVGSAVGTVLGYAVVGSLKTSGKVRSNLMLVLILMNAVGYGVLGFVRTPIIALLLSVADGFASGYVTVGIMTILQVSTPGEIRGRIIGLLSAISGGLVPVGMGLAGVAADLLNKNIPVIFAACGLTMFAIAAALTFNKDYRSFLAYEQKEPKF